MLKVRDEALLRLLDYHGRRYWLSNGWSIRFRIWPVRQSAACPIGIRYAFTLHDCDGGRLLGFDNAHGDFGKETTDHRHLFRAPQCMVRYEYRGADELICDFFDVVERACRDEGVHFEFDAEDVELEPEDDPEIPD